MQSTRGELCTRAGNQLQSLEYFFRRHLQLELVWMKTSSAPSANLPLRFGRIVLSVLLLFAVLEPTNEGQEDLHYSVGLRT